MYTKSNPGHFAKLILILLLLGISRISWSADDSNWKPDTLQQAEEGVISLPVRISPVLVEAPPRHVDLLPERAKNWKDAKSAIHPASLPLTGLPVDLYEFPVLRLKASDHGEGQYSVELALDTRGKGAVDTLVRVGDPSLFPDMEPEEHVDFRSAEFAARDLSYRIRRALRIGVDKTWRYTALNAKVDGIANGLVDASYEPGGDFVIQRAFPSPVLSANPWLQYEYELPEGSQWIVQINAKIASGGLNPILTTLSAEPVRGGGKRRVLLNLFDLFQKANPDAKDGQLEQLIIHFQLDESAKTAAQNVRIDLGRLDLYRAQGLVQANSPEIFIVGTKAGGDINLLETLERYLGTKEKITVLGGKLVATERDLAGAPEMLPKISLLTEYREKIPELFVGESILLDQLSGPELSAVLDQKVFYQKRLLWESGQSDVIFRRVDNPTRPLLDFAQDTNLEGDSYIKADFVFEDGEQYPLRLTLLGIDPHGKQVKQDYQLSTGKPIKIKDIRKLKKATLSFSQEIGAALPFPGSCLIRNIQVSSFDKTAVFRPPSTSAYVALVPAGKPIWRANVARLDISASGSGNSQIVHSFPVEASIAGEAVLKYKLEATAGESNSYGLRVRAIEEGRYVEKEFSLGQRGELPISDLYLLGVDIVVKGRSQMASSPASLYLKQFEIESKSGTTSRPNQSLQRISIGRAGIAYFSPHKPLFDPALVWLRPAYAIEQANSDLAAMNKIDATLSYAQILEGGKDVVLPRRTLAQGKYELDYVGDEGVVVNIEPSFMQTNLEQQVRSAVKDGVGKPSYSKLAKIGLLGLLVTIAWMGAKFMPRWLPFVDMVLSKWPVFSGAQLALLTLSAYLLLSGVAKDSISWAGLLLVFAYGLAVRYKLRRYLAKNWVIFSERYSIPYFLLFLILLLLCVVMLMSKQELLAEHIAVMGYYLLVTGVVIEFICFAKGAQLVGKSSKG